MTEAPVIVGFAGCTSLGYTSDSTLAAMGAGISNFTDTNVRDLFGEPAVGAQVPAIDVDAPRSRRMESLLRFGLADLERLLTPLGVTRAPLMMGLATDLNADDIRRMAQLLEKSPLVAMTNPWMFPYGRSSTFAALKQALALLDTKSAELAVVGGIDSLCAPETMRKLVEAERVLGTGTEGTIPGEGVAFVLLVRPDHRLARAATAVRVEGVALQRAAVPFTKADNVSADALTATFRALREAGARRVDRVVPAHSGEGYFGRSFSHAYLRETDLMPEPLEVELTADRIGDVGAAAGIIGLALATYLMVQDRIEEDRRALVYSESDTGEIGAAILEGAPSSWQRTRTEVAP